jgi:hypothetical protein
MSYSPEVSKLSEDVFTLPHMKQFKKWTILSVMIIATCQIGKAQNFPSNPYTAEINAGIGAVSNVNLQLRKNFYLFGRGRFIIAPGIRFGYATAQSVDYISAPFEITKEPKNVDTLRIGGSAIATANISLNLAYQFTEKLSLGFDIDLFGLSFGGSQTGTWIPGEASSQAMSTPIANVKLDPTSNNILLGGDNDRGTLASGLNLSYLLTDNFGIKAGLGFLFTEYTSEIDYGAANNDRWRAKTMQFSVGANYHF